MNLKSPVRAVLEITNNCNFSCIYCFNSCSPKNNTEELSTSEWKKILDDLEKLEIFEVSFTGGEPFIRKDIFELLEYADKIGFDITINTNASLLNEEKIKKLKNIFLDKSKLVRIMISLDTLDKNRYRWLTNNPLNLRIIQDNINLLINAGFKVTMTSVLTNKTKKDFPKLLIFFLKNKIKYWNISGPIPYGKGKECLSLFPSNKDWKFIFSLLKNKEEQIKKLHKKISVQTNKFNLNKTKIQNLTCENGFNCPAAKTEISIGPDGNLSPCIAFRGIIKSQERNNIKKYWDTNPLIKKLRNRNFNNLRSICADCNLKKMCLGGCPALALRYFNSIEMPDPRCPLIPKIEDITNNKKFIGFISNITGENMLQFYPQEKHKLIMEEVIKEFLQKNIQTWIIRIKNTPVGYMMFEKEDNKNIFLISIQIGEKYKHKGCGSLLLGSLESYARDNKISIIKFQVKKANKNAINFYIKSGYIQKSSDKDYIYFEKKI